MTPEQSLAGTLVANQQLQTLWSVAQSQVNSIQENDICYKLGYGSLVPTLQIISNLACQVVHQAVYTALGYAARCGTADAWGHYSNAENSTVAACNMDQTACHMGEFPGDPFGQAYQSGNPSGYCLNYHYFNCVGAQVNAASYAVNEATLASQCKPLPPPPPSPPHLLPIRMAPPKPTLPSFYNVFLRGPK
jgi:hypothetical protein